MRVFFALRYIIGGLLFLPMISQALTFAEAREMVIPFLYGMVGFFGALAFGIFGAGFVTYLVRMALDYRMYGIDVMTWGITIMFVVVILVGILVLIE